MDVRQVLSWPSTLISEWMAYDQLDVIPDPNWQFGLIASILANSWGRCKSKPEDWIPRARKSRKRQSEQDQLGKIWAAGMMAEAAKIQSKTGV